MIIQVYDLSFNIRLLNFQWKQYKKDALFTLCSNRLVQNHAICIYNVELSTKLEWKELRMLWSSSQSVSGSNSNDDTSNDTSNDAKTSKTMK